MLLYSIPFFRASNVDIAMDPFGNYVLAQVTNGSATRDYRVDLTTRKLTLLTPADISSSDIVTW
jgi:hypothetical protein